jgi:preprotein translocase subunit YajC
MGSFMWIVVAMFAVLLLTQILGARKEKKRQQELMDSLKRHDKVQTVGGMLGTVVEVGEKDVVLRVEEGRIRVVRSAVQTILNSAPKAGASVESKPESKAEAKAAGST